MIYDSFIFNNELDLLELRIKELWDVVDKFIIVEMPITFSGKPKPNYLKENKPRFEPYWSKIESIVLTGWPDGEEAWTREVFQRNAQRNFNFEDEDLITLTDADEIPHPDVYKVFRRKYEIAKLSQMILTYWVDVGIPNTLWCKGAICTGKALRWNSPSQIRAQTASIAVTPGGWHFTSLGNADFIRSKIQSFSHYSEPQCIEMLKDTDLNRGSDLASGSIQKFQIDNRWPKDIWMNPERWSKHLCDR